jgi:hypothetical protein
MEIEKEAFAQIADDIREIKNAITASNDWRKKAESLKIAAGHHKISDNLIKLHEYRANHTEDGGLQKKAPTKLEGDEYHNLREILNYFEGLAAGIKHGVYDDAILRDTLRGMAISIYSYSEHVIIEQRRSQGNPSIWKLYEDLANRWENANS